MNLGSFRWNSPLNALRILAVLTFLCALVAMLLPSTRQFLAGSLISLTGILAIQLFNVRSIEVGPDKDEREITTLHLNS